MIGTSTSRILLRLRAVLGCLAMAGLAMAPLRAGEADEVRLFLIRGEYEKVIATATERMAKQPEETEWPLLLGEAQTELGRYAEARETLVKGMERFPSLPRLRLAAVNALRATGAVKEAKKELEPLDPQRGGGAMYGTAAEIVARGRAALLFGTDPKIILERLYDPARKAQPDLRDSYLACGDLALEKGDSALAAKTFANATKKFPEDADMWFGLARAYAPSDGEAMRAALEKVFAFNERHVGGWLLVAENQIDAENYPEAEKALATALKTNPNRPEAHALRAVLANLRADAKDEAAALAAARKFWRENPAVPHLVGRKLSQKYRFAEGAALQREALKYDPQYLPAKAQLAQDLLRLGKNDEGWKLADEVQQADPYDVVAFNLTTLRDALAKFRTLTSEHFAVRMDPREADIYGADALALLERAHATLTKKYGLTLDEKTVVEIFPDQKDFAIRTFGLPGGVGYLGVCFGRLITANSPAAHAGTSANWEAVLWHEFTHVITLTMTKNKMPRWLSEGISVYEERQARGNWGERMKPRYRAMILGEDLTPVSKLSATFMQPKTPAHLGFAYYESSLVVEWLTQRWGLEKMKRVLADLARGGEINAALAAHFAPIEKLDAEFAAHAQQLAKATGPKLDWSAPPRAILADETKAQQWAAANPNNFTGLFETAKAQLEAKRWAEAKAPLQKLIALWPEQHDAESAYALLAKAHRELGETDAELAMLNKVVTLCDDAPEACTRLIELAAARKDWRAVIVNAERFAAINPLIPAPHRSAAEAHEALAETTAAIASYRTLLRLDPPNPAEFHYRLARLLHTTGDAAAKREALLALEDTPRFRAALDLLLAIDEGKTSKPAKP